MKRLSARYLLTLSTEQIYNSLTGTFILVFDDGEIETNCNETTYSSFGWDLLREYPLTPVLVKHHVSELLVGTRLGSDTHLELLGRIVWSVHDAYLALPNLGMDEVAFRDILSKRIYQITNNMYNNLSVMCEAYVGSIDITDFMEIIGHPKTKELMNNVEPTDISIDKTYRGIKDVIFNDPKLAHNPITKLAKSRLSNMLQVLQSVGPRGFITDTDSHRFKTPILRGHAQGFRSFHDSLIESRSAAKSLMFSKTPLQQAEYFSRRLQLMSQTVKNLHHCDCGTTDYTLWNVRVAKKKNGVFLNGDLELLNGKNYIDDNGQIKMISPDDKHLIGKTIKLRTAIHCAHPDPYGICSTCFGGLSVAVPANTNIGQLCCTLLAQQTTQSVLSLKHVDGNAFIDGIVLGNEAKPYLQVSADDNSYQFAKALKGKHVELVIRAEYLPNITDITDVKNVEDLNITRISELFEIGLLVVENGVPTGVDLSVNIGKRLASLTLPMLAYMREYGWSITPTGNYAINLSKWDWNESFLTLPLRHVNLSDHSKDVAYLLESSVANMQERDKSVSPDAALIELYNLVNEKLFINLAILDVVLYSVMIVSAEDMDYSLPKPWTTSGLGVMKKTMLMRSLGAGMAYQNHSETLTDPVSFVYTNRPDHPMDGILCPKEVFEQP